MKLSLTTQSSSHHICIFGDPGTGKSTLASKLAEEGYNLTWISIDNGHSILYKLSEAAQERIDLIRLPDTRDFPVGITTCLEISKGKKVRICDKHGQVECTICKRADNQPSVWSTLDPVSWGPKDILVIDNISQVADSAMNFACEGKADSFKSGYDEYRLQGFLMNKLLTNLQQAQFNWIVIAHVTEVKMESLDKKLVPVIGSDAFSRFAGKYFDHIVFCSTMNKAHKYGSSTTFMNNVTSKSRTDIEIEKMDKASLLPIMKSVVVKQREEVKAAEIIEAAKETLKELEAKEKGEENVSAVETDILTGNNNVSSNNTERIVATSVIVPASAIVPVANIPAVSAASSAMAALAKLRGGR